MYTAAYHSALYHIFLIQAGLLISLNYNPREYTLATWPIKYRNPNLAVGL